MLTTEKKSERVAGSELHGVVFRPLVEHQDSRGSFTEFFQETWDIGISPVQWSVVQSKPGVFRGLHLHWRHDEYFCLVSGHCLVALYDVRHASPSRGDFVLYEFGDNNLYCVSFPPGILHGLYYFQTSIHLQAVSESYLHYQNDDNLGCRWDDPALNIPWPFSDPLLSAEAASYPDLETLLQESGKHLSHEPADNLTR